MRPLLTYLSPAAPSLSLSSPRPPHLAPPPPHLPPQLFLRLPALSTLSFPPSVLPRPLAHPPGTDPASRSTLFTTASGHPAAPRPALLVSSTSWTLDEDFGVLVEALELYDRAARALARSRSSSASASPADAEGTDLPRLGALRTDSTGTHRPREVPPLVVLVTGRGARRAAFEQEVERREKARWEWVRCRTGWVERGDYPRLLGACRASPLSLCACVGRVRVGG